MIKGNALQKMALEVLKEGKAHKGQGSEGEEKSESHWEKELGRQAHNALQKQYWWKHDKEGAASQGGACKKAFGEIFPVPWGGTGPDEGRGLFL